MTTLPVYPVVKWDNPVYDGFIEYYLRSRLYNIRPNNSGLSGVNSFDR